MAHATADALNAATAVVTGSSSGIGRAIALELARAGASVLVHGRQMSEELESVADKIRESGVKAEIAPADLSDPSQLEGLAERAWAWHGGVDIWVNNAGADVLTGTAHQWSFERKLEALSRVDVLATVRLGRSVGARMKAARGGVIVNMGWDGAARNGRRQRRDVCRSQSRGGGLLAEPGAIAGAGSASELHGPGLDQDPVG